MRSLIGTLAAASALVLAGPAAADIGFVPPVSFPTPDAEDVVTGDFNGDGLLDAAVANTTQASMSVLIGDGQANFTAATSFPVPGHPADLAAGDYNNDGNLDIAVTGQETGNVTVWPGGGSGNFGPSYDVPAAGNANRLVAGFLNNDTAPDLVVTDGSAFSVDVLINNGAGGFAPPVAYGLSNAALDVAVGDLNGDGILDIVTAGGDPGAVSVLLGNGDGTYRSEIQSATSNHPQAVAIADYDGDRNLDVVAGEGPSGVEFFYGDGTGQFGHHLAVPVPNTRVGSVAAGDLDGDGRADLAMVSGVATIQQGGDGGLRPAVSHDGGGVRLTIGDVDGDSMPDLLIAANQNLVVLGNTSTPPLAAPVVARSANVEPVRGSVLVKLPGRRGFIRLEEADHIPIGSQLDTRHGTVRLTTAAGGGKTQSGTFRGGLFKLKQSRKQKLKPVTELALTGKLRCARTHGPVRSSASRSRHLFGNAHGRFRTRGRNSVAAIRGTKWLVKDTCSGTLTRSFRGTVVVRDLVKHTTHVLHSGQRYLARARRGNR